MQLNKRDVITIVLLSVLFFSIAVWNVGLAQAPVTSWQGTENRTFYVDLGQTENVTTVYFLVKRGNATVNVYTGSPDNWTSSGEVVLKGDSSWSSCNVRVATRYLQFNAQPGLYESRPNFYWSVPNPTDVPPRPFIEIVEIAVLNRDNQKVPIIGLVEQAASDADLSKLVDEQGQVECPPTYMSQTYFDEVYFARATQDYLRSQAPFERTHPPLGKLIQSSGIAVFGDTPFGWRIIGVVFATLMIPLMYLLGKKLFGTWIGGFAAAFLLTFDFMHFTMARMGTVDTYVVFFALASQLCFLTYFVNVVKNGWKTSVLPLFFAVLFFALGFSTKWLVLYGALGMLALLAALRIRDVIKLKDGWGARYAAFFDHPFLWLLGFVGVVGVIYFVTYLPDMIIGNSFSDIFKLQFEMYNFHATLTATHTYASAWWSWPILVSTQGYVPLWLASFDLPNSVRSTISVFGNPAVWWVGFACILVVTERAIRGKELWSMLTLKLSKIMVGGLKIVRLFWTKYTGKMLNSEKRVPFFSDMFNLMLKKSAHKAKTLLDCNRRWDLAAVFIAVVFFFSWVPYVFISRATFIYHFYISVPFLCLASAYLINKYWNTKWGKIATIAFFAAVVFLFGFFYPVISGAPTDASWIEKLRLFPSWYF